MIDWIQEHRGLFACMTAVSALLFVASLLLVPALGVRIPADYFEGEERPPGRWSHRHPLVRLILMIGRNILGILFIGAGVAMLVLPGQGLLTVLVGVLLIDFPGKYRFERWLLSRPRVHRAINWLRRRAGAEPLRLEGRSTSSS